MNGEVVFFELLGDLLGCEFVLLDVMQFSAGFAVHVFIIEQVEWFAAFQTGALGDCPTCGDAIIATGSFRLVGKERLSACLTGLLVLE